jgi:hypothetical protein
MSDEIVFEQASTSATGGLFFVVVFGFVLSLTGAIIGLISASIIGAPLIYLATLAGSIALGVYATKRGKAMIRIVRSSAGLRLTVTGPAVNIDVEVPTSLEYWYSYFRIPRKHGGDGRDIVVYNVKITVGERVIGFKTNAGFEGSERTGWTHRAGALPNATDVFVCPRCFLLPDLLRLTPLGPARADA